MTIHVLPIYKNIVFQVLFIAEGLMFLILSNQFTTQQIYIYQTLRILRLISISIDCIATFFDFEILPKVRLAQLSCLGDFFCRWSVLSVKFLYQNKALCIFQLPVKCVLCLSLYNIKPFYVPATNLNCGGHFSCFYFGYRWRVVYRSFLLKKVILVIHGILIIYKKQKNLGINNM